MARSAPTRKAGLAWSAAVDAAVAQTIPNFSAERIREDDKWVGEFVSQAAPVLSEHFLANAGVLRETRSARGDFESRLHGRYARAFDAYELCLIGCTESGSAHGQNLRWSGDESSRVVYFVLRALHARACRVATEIYALLISGFPIGAEVLWRTLHEISVVAFVIGEGGPQTAERYRDHGYLAAGPDVLHFQQHAKKLKQRPYTKRQLEAAQNATEFVVSKYKNVPHYGSQYGWAAGLVPARKGGPPSFGDLAAYAKLDHLSPFHRLSSRRLHADAKGTRLNTVLYRERSLLQAGATNVGLAETAHVAAISLTQTTVAFLCRGVPPERNLGVILGGLIQAEALSPFVEAVGSEFGAVELAIQAEEGALARRRTRRRKAKVRPVLSPKRQ